MATEEDVYCTLVMSDSYLPGAAVLAQSLKDCGTKKKLACLSLYNYVIPVERVPNPQPKNLYLMNRPDLLFAFTKINLWRQTQFRKIVYLDADVVALRAPDELFDIPDDFAAAPDVGWPDAFNTGVMVVAPNIGDYWALNTLAGAGDSFDGADQGLLNQYYEHKPWKRLSFTYNVTPSANYQYEPAYRYYKRAISLVHFIGGDKPWRQGRHTKNGPGGYQELLSRWWAVYDRHFRVSTSEYASGQRQASTAVQRETKSEAQSKGESYSAAGYPAQSTQSAPPPGASAVSTELPMTEPGEGAKDIDQVIIEPAPTVQPRTFSAPHMEWDATKAPPPTESKPEAASLPAQTYEFSADSTQFKPPASYPEPPKDMWYNVPEIKPKVEAKPPSIFPWEERQRPKPTRKFVEDEPPALPPAQPEPDFAGADELEVEADAEPTTPTIQINDHNLMFGASNRNAWDDVGGIEEYVRALTAFQRNRGKLQVLQVGDPKQQHILSPTNEPTPEDLVRVIQKRRESLILTDFPTAVERPSLPVTPAPRRRPNFWGEERDEQGELPAAEGVPEQTEWNPDEQLAQLRKNSLIGPGDLKLPSKSSIPRRDMPGSAAPIPKEALGQPHVPVSGRSNPHGLLPVSGASAVAKEAGEGNAAKAATTFAEPGFGAPSSAPPAQMREKEEVLSPTEHGSRSFGEARH